MRTVVKVQTALRRARERELAQAIALDSKDPKVAKHAARPARQYAETPGARPGGRGARKGGWKSHRGVVRLAAPGPAAQASFETALQALIEDADGERFVAQCLELDPVEVRRLVGRLDVS